MFQNRAVLFLHKLVFFTTRKQVALYGNIDSSWDDLKYEGYTLNEATTKPPLRYFEASPIFGKRVAAFSIELHDDHSLSIVITQVSVHVYCEIKARQAEPLEHAFSFILHIISRCTTIVKALKHTTFLEVASTSQIPPKVNSPLAHAFIDIYSCHPCRFCPIRIR